MDLPELPKSFLLCLQNQNNFLKNRPELVEGRFLVVYFLIDAFINSLNNGCGFNGRDLNSG
jgi:hypothetical protein